MLHSLACHKGPEATRDNMSPRTQAKIRWDEAICFGTAISSVGNGDVMVVDTAMRYGKQSTDSERSCHNPVWETHRESLKAMN